MGKKLTYWKVYDEYPEHVVVMPRTYMFVGYENSARILSYILGIKLMKKKKGLVAASSDLDGIIMALNRYHINYICLSHGQIEDSNSFTDNAYKKYLELSKTVTLYEYNDVTNKYDIVVC